MNFSSNLPTLFEGFVSQILLLKILRLLLGKVFLNNFCLKENFLMNVLLLHDIKLSTEPILVS